jgi:hypothetical protein
MKKLTPRVLLDGKEIDFIDGALTDTGGLRAATFDFKLPVGSTENKNIWNKEVLLYFNDFEGTPIFRGYVKRIKETFNTVRIYSQDALGYLVMAGNADKAVLALTDDDNLDGLTVGNAIRKAISKAQLSSKIGTDYIGDTTPLISSSRPPLRGTLGLLNIVKQLLSRAIDDSGVLPRPNIAKLVDDGEKSQLVIELESDVDSTEIKHKFSEYDNITNIKIINRKVPTIVVVNGKDKAKGIFSHDSAVEAYDRNYLEVSNKALESPAACRDFAQKVFRANLQTQFEYGIDTIEGIYLTENDVVRIQTKDPEFSGNYRISGKKIAFTAGGLSVGLNINRKPPTLAEFIKQQDN